MKVVEEDMRVMLKGKYYDEKAKPKYQATLKEDLLTLLYFKYYAIFEIKQCTIF